MSIIEKVSGADPGIYAGGGVVLTRGLGTVYWTCMIISMTAENVFKKT